MRAEDIQKEIDRITNNRRKVNMNIDQLIENVVTQLDKDPMDQMVDTETIIREFTKKIVNGCRMELGKSMKGDPYTGDVYDCEYNTSIDDQIAVLKDCLDRFGINDE